MYEYRNRRHNPSIETLRKGLREHSTNCNTVHEVVDTVPNLEKFYNSCRKMIIKVKIAIIFSEVGR